MKHLVKLITIGVLLFFPAIGFSSYLIQLKNGSSFITSKYWVDGTEVKFYYAGGVVGIPQDTVQEVQASDKPVKGETKAPAPQEAGDEAQGPAGEETVGEGLAVGQEKSGLPSEKKMAPSAAEEEAMKQEKQRLMLEMDIAARAFNTAKQGKDEKAIKETRTEVTRARIELSNLEIRVEAAYGGVMPPWWGEGQ